ncbi:MAG: hypothetical protein R3282_08755, partial [Rhodothermales bacterium]|nr:hypothetical protein [Rhodothermales bacterium]
DQFPSISADGTTPLVTFTSTRTFPNGRLWIASLLQGVDSNPDYLPPWIDFAGIPFPFLHSAPGDWVFFADDESGLTAVTVSYGLSGETPDQVSAADDGNSGDGDAGDGLWGAEVPGFPLGRDFVISASATDTDGNVASTFEWFGRTTAVQDAGNAVFGMPGGYIDGIEWPAGSGDGYLSGGGLWIGADNKVIDSGMWTPDPSVEATDGPGESSQDIVYGLQEPDWLGESDRLGLKVTQTSYQWKFGAGDRAGRENGLVLEYAVRNTGSVSSNFAEVFVGLYLDVDILPQ